MNEKQLGLGTTAVMALTALLAVACQTYDFEPVTPLAIAQEREGKVVSALKQKPNMMLLVDKSGSMNLPTNSTSTCTLPGGGACDCTATTGGICGSPGKSLCDPAKCPTRWSELQKAMGGFLTGSSSLARLALSQYPTSGGCGVDAANPALARTGFPTEDSDAALMAKGDEIRDIILNQIKMCNICGTQPNCANCTGGGTPTGNSIRQIGGSLPPADETRASYLLLLTDGLPNCNPDNPNDGSVGSPTKNLCTLENGTCTLASGCETSPNNKIGCLDDAKTVADVAALRQSRGVQTIVIGLGAETGGGPGPNVLTAMAAAGGFTDTYYQANDAAQLTAALSDITSRLENPCEISVEPIADVTLAAVYVGPENGALELQPRDSWTYDASASQIRLLGDLCTRVTNTTEPLKIEVRVLKPI